MHFIHRLESRLLFASLSITDGIVNYTGSDKDEQFSLSPVPGRDAFYLIAGTAARPIQRVVNGPIKKVSLDMRGGIDGVGVDTGRFRARIHIDLGRGNDGGATNSRGPSTIMGGAGDDSLTSSNGDDLLEGGPGDDRLKSGAGKDTLVGGPGLDTLDGGPGDDLLFLKDGAADYGFQGGEGDDRASIDVGLNLDYYSPLNGPKKRFMRSHGLESMS